MTLDEISEAWNTLRNDVYGRGLASKLPPALAADFDRQYSAWRKALIHMPAAADMMASAYARKWVTKYRALKARVQKSGLPVTASLPQTPFEQGLAAVDSLSRNIALGAGIGGLLLVGFFLASKVGRNGR